VDSLILPTPYVQTKAFDVSCRQLRESYVCWTWVMVAVQLESR